MAAIYVYVFPGVIIDWRGHSTLSHESCKDMSTKKAGHYEPACLRVGIHDLEGR